MEITSNKLLPHGPAQQPAARPESATPFDRQATEQEKGEESGEYLPSRQGAAQQSEAALDYRQLVLQARFQQAGVQQNESPQREAQRVGVESMKVQQAIGAYRDNAELQEEGGELMPRLDSYV